MTTSHSELIGQNHEHNGPAQWNEFFGSKRRRHRVEAANGVNMMSVYFSDRQNGPRARTEQNISPAVWGGLVATVQSLINSGAFGLRFPELCPDVQATCGSDPVALADFVKAEMPGLAWPLETYSSDGKDSLVDCQGFAPDTLLVLDFIEFVHASVAKPILEKYHKFYGHRHLTFDKDKGQEDFREIVNRLFERNGVAFELLQDGLIQRVLPPVLGEELKQTLFNTGDLTLDRMLDDCRSKFSSCNPLVRREALERLWDAWERLKSLNDGSDKSRSVKIILDKVTTVPQLRERLESEALELTCIGNSHHIRHSETSQVPVNDPDLVDYLFYRMFALINLILRKI